MKNKTGILALIIACAALVLSIFNMTRAGAPAAENAGDVQYVMYLGTNDKDTNLPKFMDYDQAKEKLDSILTKHFEGFTIQEANGGWTNEDGTVSHEYTLVIYLSDTSSEAVHAAADDLLSEFNQSSVLIQENKTKTEFYSGQ